MLHTSDGFADDIVEISNYEAALPSVKKFLAWHLPRKQFVRHHQWCEEIGRMLDDSPLQDGILKYLGLPGLDLLDLRHFHAEICEKRNVNLRFLGFNGCASNRSTSGNSELNVSLDEVRRLSRVDQMSDVIGDRIEFVANDQSIASERARKMGPYDVINLDLCDGFGSQSPGEATKFTNYDAVNSLLALQSRFNRPWLLLLTTRADKGNIDDKVLKVLLGKYVDNLNSCPSFLDSSREKFSIGCEASAADAINTAEGLLPVYLIGLCKWLLNLALAHNPPTSVELCSVIGYRVHRAAVQEDIISLALRFTPTFQPVKDNLGLAKHTNPKVNECTLATRMLKRVAKRKDADKILSENHELNENMIHASVDLLKTARYDTSGYRAWVQSRLDE